MGIEHRVSGPRLGRVAAADVFAWTASLVLHAALFGALYLVMLRQEPGTTRVIMPEARLAGPQVAETVPPMERALELAESPAPAADPVDIAPPSEIPLSAVMPETAGSLNLPTMMPSPSDRPMTGEIVPGSSITGPLTTFFGETGNAYKVVYIVDLSQSIAMYNTTILKEMRRSIRELVPSQRFNIVMAETLGKISTVSNDRLVPANAKHKQQANEFLARYEGYREPGEADPVAAFRAAFSARPELIYLLTDGDYLKDEKALDKVLRELNHDKRARITIITFDPAPRVMDLLKKIAEPHGGRIRAVEPE